MAYRNGTYVAFDGLNTTDPTKSDIRFYNTLKAWNALKTREFRLVNSHDRTAAARDGVSAAHLKTVIRERLANSKHMLIILSPNTRRSGSFLSYEIEHAIDYDKLPIICCYTGVTNIAENNTLGDRWPNSLRDRINKISPNHIPFTEQAIIGALR